MRDARSSAGLSEGIHALSASSDGCQVSTDGAMDVLAMLEQSRWKIAVG